MPYDCRCRRRFITSDTLARRATAINYCRLCRRIAISLRGLPRRLRVSPFAQDSALLSLGAVLAQGIGLAAVPLLSRLYPPAAFGVFALFSVVTGVVAITCTLRYEIAIVSAGSDAEAAALARLSLVLCLAIGGALVFAASLATPSALNVLGLAPLGPWFPLAVLCGAAFAVTTTCVYWLNRHRAYRAIAILRVTQAVTFSLAALAFGVLGFERGQIAAQTIATLVLAPALYLWLAKTIALTTAVGLKDAARRNNRSPKYLLPTALMDVTTLQLPVILIMAWFGSADAGHFAMAWRVLALPMVVVGAAIGQVFYQRFSAIWPDASAAKALLFKTWLLLAILALPPMALLGLYGEQIFGFTLGADWRKAGAMASIMAPMFFVMFLSSPTSTTCIALRIEKPFFLFAVAAFVYRPMCLLIGFTYGTLFLGLWLLVAAEIIQIVVYQLFTFSRIQ